MFLSSLLMMFRRSEEDNQGQRPETQEALRPVFLFTSSQKACECLLAICFRSVFQRMSTDRFSHACGWCCYCPLSCFCSNSCIQKVILAYHDSFPFPFQRLACSSQAVSHSETLRDFTIWKVFSWEQWVCFSQTQLAWEHLPELGTFQVLLAQKLVSVKQSCVCLDCLWLQGHCQKAMTGDHSSEGHWLHEILLTKQEDVACSGSAAVSGGSSKEKRNGKA